MSMPIPEGAIGYDEYVEVVAILRDALDRVDELTDFECEFVSDVMEKLEQYKERTFLSGKQRNMIDQIYEKLER